MAAPSINETVIEPSGSVRGYWRDLYAYRELFLFLTWRDILVRYKQTAIGVLWAVLRPLMTVAIFTLVFSRGAGLKADGNVPYALMVFAAMLPWQLFATSFQAASVSLVSERSLLTKVYFPRLIIPAIAPLAALVDFMISLVIFFCMMAWYRIMPTWHILLLPAFTALAITAAFGASLWISTLNVKYRDFEHIVPFIVQMGAYVSPVAYSLSLVPERWRLFYFCNPMSGVIGGFRWALLGESSQLYMPGFCVSLALTTALLVSGIWFFRRFERFFADII